MGQTTHILPCPDEGDPREPATPFRPPLRVVKGELVRLAADERSVITTETDLRAALDEALRRGFEQGEIAGAGRAAEAARILVSALDQSQQILAGQVRELLALDARLVVDLAVGLAEWFLGMAIAADPEAVTSGIVAALVELDTAAPLVLTVGSEHLAFIAERLDGVVPTVRADPTFGPADFELTSTGPTIERRWMSTVERFSAELQ